VKPKQWSCVLHTNALPAKTWFTFCVEKPNLETDQVECFACIDKARQINTTTTTITWTSTILAAATSKKASTSKKKLTNAQEKTHIAKEIPKDFDLVLALYY
jgi:predicted protein tyrosine phosphatase